MTLPAIDRDYLRDVLFRLLKTPSPSGMTDEVVRVTCAELDALGISYELTRRGAIRAHIPGERYSPRRAVIAHLDTLGAMVRQLHHNGRLGIAPIGHWSARFAEGARVTIHGDAGLTHRGTILPLKASGHVYNEAIDKQPSEWSNLEIRVDEPCTSLDHLWDLGFRVGDFVSIDSDPVDSEKGFINARHLDDKAGVASMLAAAKAVLAGDEPVPLDCHLLFTISEEVGVGASHVLHGDIAEMVSIDNGTIAPNQNTCEYGVTLAMMDSAGPFDRHLTQHLIDLCRHHEIEFSRDVFRYYRSDSASALEAGNDIRTALICFALDASHGYERSHINSLDAVARLVARYITSAPLFHPGENVIGSDADFPIIDPETHE